MNLPAKQRGAGVLGWLLIILLFGGALTVGLKLFPIYMDNRTMSTILDKMELEAGHGSKRDPELYGLIEQRFKLNNIRDFGIRDNIEIDRNEGETTLILKYEVRTPFIANIDLVTYFDKRVKLRE